MRCIQRDGADVDAVERYAELLSVPLRNHLHRYAGARGNRSKFRQRRRRSEAAATGHKVMFGVIESQDSARDGESRALGGVPLEHHGRLDPVRTRAHGPRQPRDLAGADCIEPGAPQGGCAGALALPDQHRRGAGLGLRSVGCEHDAGDHHGRTGDGPGVPPRLSQVNSSPNWQAGCPSRCHRSCRRHRRRWRSTSPIPKA